MKYLLDTHTFLWAAGFPDKLSAKARNVIEYRKNTLLLSAASGCEIAIKCRLGKLMLSETPARFVLKQMKTLGIGELPISLEHALFSYELPQHHKDPFDRILVSQAVVEKIPLISNDKRISKYKVKAVW